MTDLPRVLDYVRGSAWAIEDGYGATVQSVLLRRCAGERLSRKEIKRAVGNAKKLRAKRLVAAERLQARTGGTIAVIPVIGVLAHRAGAFDEVSGVRPGPPEANGLMYAADQHASLARFHQLQSAHLTERAIALIPAHRTRPIWILRAAAAWRFQRAERPGAARDLAERVLAMDGVEPRIRWEMKNLLELLPAPAVESGADG